MTERTIAGKVEKAKEIAHRTHRLVDEIHGRIDEAHSRADAAHRQANATHEAVRRARKGRGEKAG